MDITVYLSNEPAIHTDVTETVVEQTLWLCYTAPERTTHNITLLFLYMHILDKGGHSSRTVLFDVSDEMDGVTRRFAKSVHMVVASVEYVLTV